MSETERKTEQTETRLRVLDKRDFKATDQLEVPHATFIYHEPAPKVGKGEKVPPHYRSTAAVIVLRDGSAFVGMSTCSPGDQFNKKIGRIKAYGRAVSRVLWGLETGQSHTRVHRVYRVYMAQQAIALAKHCAMVTSNDARTASRNHTASKDFR